MNDCQSVFVFQTLCKNSFHHHQKLILEHSLNKFYQTREETPLIPDSSEVQFHRTPYQTFFSSYHHCCPICKQHQLFYQAQQLRIEHLAALEKSQVRFFLCLTSEALCQFLTNCHLHLHSCKEKFQDHHQ